MTCKQGNISDSCKYFRVSKPQLIVTRELAHLNQVGSEDAQTLLEDTRIKGLDTFKEPTRPAGRNRKAARTSLITSPSRSKHAEALSNPGTYEHHRKSLGSDIDRSRAEYGPIMVSAIDICLAASATDTLHPVYASSTTVPVRPSHSVTVITRDTTHRLFDVFPFFVVQQQRHDGRQRLHPPPALAEHLRQRSRKSADCTPNPAANLHNDRILTCYT